MTEPRTDLRSQYLARRFSAQYALGKPVLAILFAIAAGIVVMVVQFPAQFTPVLTTTFAVLYLLSTIDRNVLLLRGINSPALVKISEAEALAVPDDELPVYTVLLPVYHEPDIVRNLLEGVGKIVYPRDKLEVLLLIEEDDIATQTALLDFPLDGFRIVIVPDSQPKTKPKACNYGLSLPELRGEMITIYDAEDIPDPLQLRRAIAAFQRLPAEVVCLQGRLSYFNESQNLLTKWFSMEYDQWFGAILPAVEQARCVVPLGGTSCHIPTRVWREIGGWDEYNVTEDADLGVRLARYGYRTLILDSITYEEANSDLINWIRQRSRWYKGYLQTVIVHLRDPVVLIRAIGWKATLRLVNLTGLVPILNAFNAFLWSTMLIWIIARPDAITLMFPPATYYLSIMLLMLASPLSVFAGVVAVVAMGKPYLLGPALLAPLYWLLQSAAAIKAIYQLFLRPSHWEKTVHGLDDRSLTTVAGR